MKQYNLQNKTLTMSKYRAKKSMNVLFRLKQQQQSQQSSRHNETPTNSDNEVDSSDDEATILVNNHTGNDKSHIQEKVVPRGQMNQTPCKDEDDLYTPLSPEEADEDQLAEFFTNCDSHLFEEEGQSQEDEIIKKRGNQTMDVTHVVPKRHRLSREDLNSCSLSSFMISDNEDDDDDDYNDNRGSSSKRNRCRLQAKSASSSPRE